MQIKTRIKRHEVGLLFRHGDYRRGLGPGAYWLPARWLGLARVERVDTLAARFEHELLDVLLEDASLRERLLVVDLVADQRALVWKDGRLEAVLGAGRHAFWKREHAFEVEVHDVGGQASPRFEHDRLDAVLSHPDAAQHFEAVRIAPCHAGLFFRGGELVDTLDAGLAVFWKRVAGVSSRTLDLREQVAEVSGQEIMTRDKVTLRVNLLVTWRVTDAVRAATAVEDHAQALYRQAQLALRAAVGGRTLDALLADKEAVSAEVASAIAERCATFGVEVADAGLRDVILPGDMKTILNQVIEAQKQSEANLIRRREETAAARSQANTAKLLADNPVLARMKELEALQSILGGAKATFVLGRGDLVEQLRALSGSDG